MSTTFIPVAYINSELQDLLMGNDKLGNIFSHKYPQITSGLQPSAP